MGDISLDAHSELEGCSDLGWPGREVFHLSGKKLVRAVFRQIWDEFHAWEARSSLKALNSLGDPRQQIPSHIHPPPCFTRVNDDGLAIPDCLVVSYGSSFSICDFESDPSPSFKPLATDVYEVMGISPVSAYESCAPVSRTILHGDDSPILPFIPFADDPAFNIRDHTSV